MIPKAKAPATRRTPARSLKPKFTKKYAETKTWTEKIKLRDKEGDLMPPRFILDKIKANQKNLI